MLGDVMMALGGYRFSMDTAAYRELVRTHEYRWHAHERMGQTPVQQYVGPGQETVELSGVIYPHFRGGLGQLDAMRREAGRGEPLLLVDGRGRVWGDYVIARITETQTEHTLAGLPRKVSFRLQLRAYGEVV